MIGQNIQGKHAELRSEHDFETDKKAEKEIETILIHLENQQSYCNITPCGGGKRHPLSVLSITVEGAKRSTMHESKGDTMVELRHVILAPGQSVDFAPGGKHLMMFGLDPKLVAGKTTMIRFKLSDGDNFAIPAKIESAFNSAPAQKL